MSCLGFPFSDEEPAHKPRSTSPWHPPARSQGALELASSYLCFPGLTGEEGLSVALSAGVEGLPYPHPGSSIWLCTLPGALFSADLRLRTLLIPNVPTFPGPELKMLTIAAWIVLDFMGLPMRTGLYKLLLLWLGLSITLIQVYHHHFWETDPLSYLTSELGPKTKFLRSLKNKRGMLSLTVLRSCVWEQTGVLSQWPPTPYSGVLLSSILLHGVLILLCLGLKASGEIPHLCKLLSRLLCSATENEWVPVPGVMGDGQAIAQGVPGEVAARQGKKKSTSIYLLISQVKVLMAFLFW